MVAFHRDALGLEVLRRFGGDIAFLRVADGFGGHTQIVGLFRDGMPSNFRRREWAGHEPARTTLHHFALSIPLDEYAPALAHFGRLGVEADTATHPWVGWRSIYVRDPEDNTVELVRFDPAVLDETAGGWPRGEGAAPPDDARASSHTAVARSSFTSGSPASPAGSRRSPPRRWPTPPAERGCRTWPARPARVIGLISGPRNRDGGRQPWYSAWPDWLRDG